MFSDEIYNYLKAFKPEQRKKVDENINFIIDLWNDNIEESIYRRNYRNHNRNKLFLPIDKDNFKIDEIIAYLLYWLLELEPIEEIEIAFQDFIGNYFKELEEEPRAFNFDFFPLTIEDCLDTIYTRYVENGERFLLARFAELDWDYDYEDYHKPDYSCYDDPY